MKINGPELAIGVFVLSLFVCALVLQDVIASKESAKHYSGFNMAIMQEVK
jgi:hypothetical protein